jgi:hypothetical protein
LAKNLFRGNLTSSQWQSVEQMLDKILTDCMSSNLYGGLTTKLGGQTWELEYNPSLSGAQFTGSKIILNDLNDSYALMHELFHGYQAYGEMVNSFNAATANLEVEAQVAKAMFMLNGNDAIEHSRNLNMFLNDPKRDAFRLLQDLLTTSGRVGNQANQQHFDRIFRETGQWLNQIDSSYRWDDSRVTFDQNMGNIINLAAGC